jgi:plastocyanin
MHMGKGNRHRRQGQPEPAVSESPKPIKVLALGVGVLLLILAGANMMFNRAPTGGSTSAAGASEQPLAGTLAPVNNGVQEVQVSMQGYTYQPSPVRVKAGVPVRFVVDLNSVRGCMRSIQIPELGVSGRVAQGSNVMEFTPTKAGTFRMTCGMGMADGTIIVEDENGIAPAAMAAPQAVPVAAPGGSCGSGGCGCGG